MRKWATLLLLWGIAWPAMADKTMSIEQLEQILTKLQGKPDGKVAGELDDLQVAERVSPERLARWEAEFPGKRTREELVKLADMSAFLNPPASEVLRDPPPDMETEERMMALAFDYVRLTTARLPDFYATRETTHFEDTLTHRADYSYSGSMAMGAHGSELPIQTPGTGTTVEYRGLHGTGVYSITVTYRDGHEVLDEDSDKRKKEEESALGLTSSGEFGPVLGEVIKDLVHTGVSFLRWEQGNGEPAAVFRYAVPGNESHFRVDLNMEGRQEAYFPAYHGEIEVDPATGEILRLTRIADSSPENELVRAAIAVDYAPVNIGDRSYICPVRGVAFSVVSVPSVDDASRPEQIKLNDVVFSHYHEFGSESRIVANAGPGGKNGAATSSAASNANNSEGPTTRSAPGPPAASASPGAVAETASGTASAEPEKSAEAPAANPAPNPAPEAAPATASHPANAAQPSTSASASASDSAGSSMGITAHQPQSHPEPTLKVSSRLVIVDVVVRKDDHPVSGLKQGDFAVFEDGVPQTIHDFTPHFADATTASPDAPTAEPLSLPPGTVTNLPATTATDSLTVLLLDGLNTQPSDVVYVRREMIKFLKTQPPNQRIAVFALGQRLRMLQGFTADTSQLTAALKKADAASPASLLPSDDQTFQERQEVTDEVTAGVSGIDVANTQNFMSNADAGQTATRMSLTLDAIQQLSRYLAGMQGRKNLIWFSGAFPLQFFAVVDLVANGGGITPTIQATGTSERELKDTADLLVAGRVAVYPVDVRGTLTQPMFTATQQTDYAKPVTGAPMSPAGSGAQETFGAGTGDAFGTDRQVSEQQIASEHATMDVLAKQTGGRAVYDSNGLQQAMAEALSDGSNYYTLAYVPTNTKYNGAQRNIEIRLVHGKDELFYRRSYYADPGDNSASSAGADKRLIGAAAVLGAPPSTQILFQARVLPEGDPALTGPMPEKELKDNPTAAFKGAPHPYVADLGVQIQDLTLAEGAQGAQTAQLEIALVAYNKDGQPVNSLGRKFDLTLPPEQFAHLTAAGKGIPVRLMLDLPSGADVVRAVVYDPASGKIGSLEIPVQVGAAGTVAAAKTSSK
jgi:VWFA-related protein